MKILVACEFSGIVRDAFAARGHDAWSCDLLPTERPGNHIQDDVKKVMNSSWDLRIGFPPCDHLAVSGARWFEEKRKDGRQLEGIEFFLFMAYWCDVLENPIGIMSGNYLQKHYPNLKDAFELTEFPRKPDQIIQPWQFGHGETKSTCLWLNKKLLKLVPTNIVEGREGKVLKMTPGPNRAKDRSRTYEGIAKAMAEQWG